MTAAQTEAPSGYRLPWWHWLWLVPVLLVVVCVPEYHTVLVAKDVLGVYWDRWSWGVLLSPSNSFFLMAVGNSVWMPIGFSLATLLSMTREPPTWQRVSLFLFGCFLLLNLPYLTDTLIWGSFPFFFDEHNVGRVRMIPFIPWPNRPWGTL